MYQFVSLPTVYKDSIYFISLALFATFSLLDKSHSNCSWMIHHCGLGLHLYDAYWYRVYFSCIYWSFFFCFWYISILIHCQILFILLIVSFVCIIFLVCYNYIILFFLWFPIIFGCYLYNCHSCQCLKMYPEISSSNLIVSDLIFISLIHFEIFLYRIRGKCQIYFYYIWVFNSPELLLKIMRFFRF